MTTFFGDLIVRVNHGGRHSRGVFQPDGKSGHQQITCNTWRACEKQWRQRRSSDRVSIDTSGWIFGLPSANPNYVPCDLNKPYEIPVQLLQVCRQIYHEAALKPFTEPTFAFTMSQASHGVNSFLTALIPDHARAITHLYINYAHSFKLSKLALNSFRGVKHVEIQVHEAGHLEGFKQAGGVEWLKSAGLQSVRFTVRYRLPASDREDITRQRQAATMAWIEREEADILAKQEEDEDETMSDVKVEDVGS
jgi:hypothetical protein